MLVKAVLGGTFDPVHNGHLFCAGAVRDQLSAPVTTFMPCLYTSEKKSAQSAADRLQMLKLAVAGTTGFAVDDREILRQKKTSTIDTLDELRGELPDASIVFIVGSEVVATIHSWRRWRELLDYAHLLVVRRAGKPPPQPLRRVRLWLRDHLTASVEAVRTTPSGKVWFFDVATPAISSTAIRDLVRRGESAQLRHYVPSAVGRYIETTGLYRQGIQSE